MYKKLLTLIIIIVATSGYLFSQTGSIQGKITDKASKEAIPFASVVIEYGGKQYGGATSDMDGFYSIKPLPPGDKYDLKAVYMGYNTFIIHGVVIKDNITFQNIEMTSSVNKLNQVEVVDYSVPLIDKDNTSDATTFTSEQIEKLPSRTANGVMAATAGVYTDLNGNTGGIRGQRSGGTNYYVDGVRQYGIPEIPEAAMDQVSVITGGVPAQYGDLTGGVVEVTTKGPSREFGMGGQLQTELDYSHSSQLGLNIQGPILKSRKDTTKSALMGYFLAAQFNAGAAGPSALKEYTLNSSLRSQLEEDPLKQLGAGGIWPNADFITQSDLTQIKQKNYTTGESAALQGKIDIKTTQNTNLIFGGNFNYSNGLDYSRANLLMNDENNPISLGYSYDVFGKFTQKFPSEKNSTSAINNVYYSIQVDYSNTNSVTENAQFRKNLFDYGYIGKFTTYSKPVYANGKDSASRISGKLLQGFADTLFTYKEGPINQFTGNYTKQFYTLYPEYSGVYSNYSIVNQVAEGGLLNGNQPQTLFNIGLWNNSGTNYPDYSESSSSQIEVNAMGSADIGKHEGKHQLQFGLSFQQNRVSAYTINADALWTLMRQVTNEHILELDKANPVPIYDQYGVFKDTINYNRLYSSSDQALFDMNLRKSMGLPVNGTDFINIDSYDYNSHTMNYYTFNSLTGQYLMKTATLNQPLSVSWFSADELFNSGHPIVNYIGYDYAGNKLTKMPSLSDFFNQTDAYGNNTRVQAPFQPIYMAGYIEDKFSFNDLIFNVGLRVDRYDLNQAVLKDPFLFFPAYTAGDLRSGNMSLAEQIPSNIGSNYVVYVDNVTNPTKITGYRNGSNWYSAAGTALNSYTSVESSTGSIQPYLVNPAVQKLSTDAFTQYTPQTTLQPRLAFSFPISDDALFFAHYDVLTKQPTDGQNLDLMNYLFIANYNVSPTIVNNPDLKPERDIDYELGFQQKLSSSSALKLSGYYREIRDLVESYEYTGAYPINYITYNNIDFGTVKGLTLSYDLRRTQNFWINANYTLQFANGTGSNATDELALLESGQPNLRTVIPLSYDQRHAIKVSFDYRFTNGKDYNGPVTRIVNGDKVKEIFWLQNTGINLSFRGGSGTPYTARNIVGNTINGSLDGSVEYHGNMLWMPGWTGILC